MFKLDAVTVNFNILSVPGFVFQTRNKTCVHEVLINASIIMICQNVLPSCLYTQTCYTTTVEYDLHGLTSVIIYIHV